MNSGQQAKNMNCKAMSAVLDNNPSAERTEWEILNILATQNSSQVLLRPCITPLLWREGLGGALQSLCGWLLSLPPPVSDVDSLHKSNDFCAVVALLGSRDGRRGYAPCLGPIIMPLIDFHIPTLHVALPASRDGLPERISNILGILCKFSLAGTDTKNCVDLEELTCH